MGEERERLLSMTDGEAESLPVPDRYQRIRYISEVEAAKWLAGIRGGASRPMEAMKKEHEKSARVDYFHGK